jgi:serine-type D-Ala-D-Ala carboxypeptidase (penicillin-binding protein 5/6)
MLLCALPVEGSVRSRRHRPVRPLRPPRSHISYQIRREPYAAALVVEAETGKILFEKNPDILRAPASLTKMMTELITLENLEKGAISLSDTVTVPSEVRITGGSRVRLRVGERIPLLEAMKAMAISSANDAAVVVATRVAGSPERFLAMMNLRAQQLGMTSTHYASIHGLDRNDQPGSITTARDQALLARTLLRHPMALRFSSTEWDTIRGRQVIHTTNRLLGRCPGVDGLKTGFTSKAGFCLVSTASRQGLRLVSVVLGAPSNRRRFSESEILLTAAFARYQKVPVIRKGQDLGRACTIMGGSPSQVRLVAGEDVALLLPVQSAREITLRVDAPSLLQPPVALGNPLGQLQVMIGDSLAAVVPAVAARRVSRAGFWGRLGFTAD